MREKNLKSSLLLVRLLLFIILNLHDFILVNTLKDTMSFSSRRRNYLLTPHRRDGLIEWMKSMLMHSFVLDALETTGADTFTHFEVLIDEHRKSSLDGNTRPSRLKQLVPTVGTFHTRLPLRQAFEVYNAKHCLTKRKHIQISFNEIRHILNLAQVMAMRQNDDDTTSSTTTTTTTTATNGKSTTDNNEKAFDMEAFVNASIRGLTLDDDDDADADDDGNNNHTNYMEPGSQLKGPRMITFDGDQTLYSDGSNFESNLCLANYLFQLLKHGVTVAVVTAAGYEYNVEKYEFRLSGLLAYFKSRGLTEAECERFYLFGGECNYLLHLGVDYRLHAVKEIGPGGWITSTKYLSESPGNWSEDEIRSLLDVAEASVTESLEDQNLNGRVIRKKRSVGLVPKGGREMPREALDESVLRVQTKISQMNNGNGPDLPFCAFNGGKDVWVDVGNKRVGVQVLGSYLGVAAAETLHIGDQFLNTGNDYAARDVCPCIWITSPDETTYILKTILRLSGIQVDTKFVSECETTGQLSSSSVDFSDVDRRTKAVQEMDVYTGEMKK